MNTVPDVASAVFGSRLGDAARFVDLLRTHGVERGLIGPREVDRLWERHVLNSAVMAERIPEGVRVIDVGSGGGFPGVPIALARSDIQMTLVEPMARRVDWLTEVIAKLDLPHVNVVRGRAEEKAVRSAVGTAEIVTARAVAPMAKLVGWCLPLVEDGGHLLAIKGASASEEVTRDQEVIHRLGGTGIEVVHCGTGVVNVPTTVVSVRKESRSRSRRTTRRR